MHTTRHLALLAALLILAISCKREDHHTNANVELAHHPEARHILAPGMGTLGIIENSAVTVYYLSEKNLWIQDKTSQFIIPEDNRGLIALGMGNLGVIREEYMHVYRLDQENRWRQDEAYSLKLPRRYQRMIAVKMPWEMGVVAFEMNGFLEFFYYDERYQWIHDETASFRIPEGIDDYFSMGNMTVAVTHENKLGVYFIHPEGDWRFLDEMVLQLPEGYQAIIPFEPGVIAVLLNGYLRFYELNLATGSWTTDPDMDFGLGI